MSYEESLSRITLNADASLAVFTGVAGAPGSVSPSYGKMYRFVKVTGSHQCGQATAATDAVVGVLQNKPQVAGQAATVALRGVSNVMAGAVLAAGVTVTCDVTGRAIAGAANVLGITLAASTAADQAVPVLLKLGN